MRMLFALVFVVPCALAQFCGENEIPDKLAVNENGDVALGCRYNECPRPYNDPDVKSGASAKCGKSYYELSCAGPLQWVGGIPRGSNLNNVVPLQCCTAQQLRDSPVGAENRKIVEFGQIFEGQVYYDKVGNVKGYDIIKNAQKIRVQDGKYAMSVTVSKLMCTRKERAAQLENNYDAEQGFGDVANPEEGTFQGFGPPVGAGSLGGLGGVGGAGGLGGAGIGGLGGFPAGGAGGFGVGPGVGGFGDLAGANQLGAAGFGEGLGGLAPPLAPPQAGFGPPLPPIAPAAAPALGILAGGGGAGAACFHGDTLVQTPSGPKKMEDLKIGDQVLAVHEGQIVGFSPVNSFLHRLPNKEAEFHRITAGGSSVSLTSLHFIHTTPCDSVQPSMKYAKDVRVGECLLRISGERQTPVPVQSNEVFQSAGIYNPMTEAGTIVADGFMASIYNVYEDTSFMSTLMGAVQNLQKLLTGEHTDNHVELPWALQYVVDHASKLF